MIHYSIGGRYEVESHELALSPPEWRRLVGGTRITLTDESGAQFVIRQQNVKERHKPKRVAPPDAKETP